MRPAKAILLAALLAAVLAIATPAGAAGSTECFSQCLDRLTECRENAADVTGEICSVELESCKEWCAEWESSTPEEREMLTLLTLVKSEQRWSEHPAVVEKFRIIGHRFRTPAEIQTLADRVCALNDAAEPVALEPECLTPDDPCHLVGHWFRCEPLEPDDDAEANGGEEEGTR